MAADRTEFEGWIDAYYRALYRHALWMTGNRDLAYDIVQETFYQAWKARQTLQDGSKAFAWLLTILRRRVFEEYGRTGRRNDLPITTEIADTLSYEEDYGGVIDLERALNTLNTAQRDILLLYSLHGLSYTQIAEYLNIPVGTVMSRLARARTEIAQTMCGVNTIAPKVIRFGPSRKRKDGVSDG